MKEYIVVVNGKPSGPYDLDELANLNIQPNTFIKTLTMADYKEAHELPELRSVFGFNYIKTESQYFASFDLRLMAWAIDMFMIALIYGFVAFVSIVIIEDEQLRVVILFAAAALSLITKVLYNIFSDCTKQQGTLGKKLLQIKVANEFGEQINFAKSLTRNCSKFLSIATLGLGYLYSFMNKKHQCLHDAIADTYVIKDRLL